MNRPRRLLNKHPPLSVLAFLFALCSAAAWGADDMAARKLAKDNNCFRCHAVEREKDGPAWSNIGAKYRQKPDGEEKLLTHLTSAPKIKLLEQGTEEEHKIAKFRDKEQLKNLVQWILSL
jgi:cytochrome c